MSILVDLYPDISLKIRKDGIELILSQEKILRPLGNPEMKI